VSVLHFYNVYEGYIIIKFKGTVKGGVGRNFLKKSFTFHCEDLNLFRYTGNPNGRRFRYI